MERGLVIQQFLMATSGSVVIRLLLRLLTVFLLVVVLMRALFSLTLVIPTLVLFMVMAVLSVGARTITASWDLML